MKISPNTLTLAPWSATEQETATTCHFRAYHLFVEKSKEVFDTPVSTSAMVVGIKIHSLMELLLNRYPDEFPDLKTLNDLGTKIMNENIIADGKDLSMSEIDHMYSLFERTVNMCQRILSHKHKTNSIGFTEVPVAIDEDFNPTDFKDNKSLYRGKIDYLLLHPTGAAAVIDAKTGAWPHLNSHLPQLRAYEVLTLFALSEKFKQEHKISLNSILSGLAYVATEQLLWDKKQTVDKITIEKNNLINNLNIVADRVFNKEIKRGNHCNSCGFKHLCGSRRGKGRSKKGKK